MYEQTARTENDFKGRLGHITLQCGDLNPCTLRGPLPSSLGPPDFPDDDFEDIEDLLDSLLYMPGAALIILDERGGTEPRGSARGRWGSHNPRRGRR
jgi:hypothetical protein